MDYRALVRQVALEEGIDPDFAERLAGAESSFNPKALSPDGAMGLMQLMPETAARFGVKNPWDPEQNVRGGMTYLRWLLDRFGGDKTLAAAGYNAGESAVEKAGGVPNFPETKNYIKRIFGPGTDVRMAATGELPPRMAVPGNPMTGMAGPERGPDLDAKTLDVLKTFLGEEKDRKPKLWEDPLFQMGLGILATPTGTGDPMMGIARGMQTGMAAAQAAQQASRESSLTELGKKLFAIDLAQRQVGISGLTPAQQVQAVSDTKQYMSPDGKTVRTVYEVKTPDGRLETRDAFTHEPADEVSGWPRVSPSAQTGGGSQKAVTPDKKIAAIDGSLAALESVEKLGLKAAEGTPTGWLGLGRFWEGLKKLPDQWGQVKDTKGQAANEYTKLTDAMLGDFARTLGGEVGVLSDQDIKRMKEIFPSLAGLFPDTESHTKAMFKWIRDILAAKRAAIEAGKDPLEVHAEDYAPTAAMARPPKIDKPLPQSGPPEHPDPEKNKRLQELRAKAAGGK